MPDEWLPEVLHAPFSDEEQGERILSLLAKLNDSIIGEIEAETYEPILGEVDLEGGGVALSAAGWCDGVSRAIDLRASAWESRLAEEMPEARLSRLADLRYAGQSYELTVPWNGAETAAAFEAHPRDE